MGLLEERLNEVMGKGLKEATNEEIYKGLLTITQAEAAKKLPFEGSKKKKILCVSWQ